MDIKEFEDLINKTISSVVFSVINENNILNISAKSRAGAEISDFLETQFVILANSNRYLFNAEQSPKGATKNPWDAKVYFRCENILKKSG